MNPTSVIPAARASIHTDPGSPVIHESALHIRSELHLFGILSESARTPPKELPTIVFINAGSTYRAGPSRLYVFLSRHLARQGFRCLRMDLCGLGDSITSHFSQENNPYPATSFRDIDITLNYLTHCMGIERIVLMGLCSGAYAAFQSAAQLSNPALVESVLINPLTFYWCDGMSLESSPALQIKSFQECMASVRQPEKWLKFLTGRSKLGISGALRMLLQRWRMWHPSRGESARPGVGMNLEQLPTHPIHDDLAGDLERIAAAGRHLACFFARSDPGYALLMLNAKRETNQLRKSGRMSVYFLDEADHTFSRRAARHALGLEITQHLLCRYRVGSGWGQE